jgi:hypothetical protein
MGFFRFSWGSDGLDQVGKTICRESFLPCPIQGFIRHAGKMFSPYDNPGTVNHGLAQSPRGQVNGLTNGYGWIINFNKTSPRAIAFDSVEVSPDVKMLISIPYPKNTTFNISATTTLCNPKPDVSCSEIFTPVASIDAVRNGRGNNYHVDVNGVVTFRIAQIAQSYTGRPTFTLPNYTTPNQFAWDTYALRRFENDGIRIPQLHLYNGYRLLAKCPSDTATSPKNGNCPEPVPIYDPDVCPSGYVQKAYDRCCQRTDLRKCVYADGSKNF